VWLSHGKERLQPQKTVCGASRGTDEAEKLPRSQGAVAQSDESQTVPNSTVTVGKLYVVPS